MPRTIALAALSVLELAPPDIVMCAAAAGYSHVGLGLLSATPDEPTYPTVGDTPLVLEIALGSPAAAFGCSISRSSG